MPGVFPLRHMDDTRNMTSLEKQMFSNDASQRGKVVLAATPIGNIGDASDRLKTLLATADIVAAEDTRRLYDLANRLQIHVNGRVVAYHDHNERDKADSLLDDVENGATILVVSDAGMPTINDPGLAIVRRAIARQLPVTCAPGPSAVLDALALSGLPTDRFCYEGFVPRKPSEQLKKFRELQYETRTIVFYETPQRIAQTMKSLLEIFPADRPMALARELTKNYEEVRRSTISGIADSVEQDPPRGEIVLVIQGASEQEIHHISSALSIEELAQLSLAYANDNHTRLKDAIAQILQDHPYPDGSLANKKTVYQTALEIKEL